MSEIRIYQDLCKGVEECGICLYVCKETVFKPSENLNRKGYRPPEAAHREACTSCENCVIFCPDLAIAVKGKKSKGEEKQ